MKEDTIPDVSQILPGHFILFEDKKYKEPLGAIGANQTGVLLQHSRVLFCRNNRMINVPYKKIAPYIKVIVAHENKDLLPAIARYFEANKKNHYLFILGLEALKSNKHEKIINATVLPILKPFPSSKQYEDRWLDVISKAEKGDLIFTFNTRSLISRIISKFEKGLWSHTAIYCGDGKIIESISKGVVERDIEVYKKKYIHIGIYRLFDVSEEEVNTAMIRAKYQKGCKYNFKGVLRLGIKTLLGMDITNEIPTPTGLIYSGELYLVDYL